MSDKEICIIRDLDNFASVTQQIESLDFEYECKVLDVKIEESNLYISRKLGVPLASKILYIKRLRIVEGIPKSIEKVYMPYDKVKGIEEENLESQSLYILLNKLFGYVIQEREEEILVVESNEEEKELLKTEDKEVLLIKGYTNMGGEVPQEYFEIVSITDFYRFRSTTYHAK